MNASPAFRGFMFSWGDSILLRWSSMFTSTVQCSTLVWKQTGFKIGNARNVFEDVVHSETTPRTQKTWYDPLQFLCIGIGLSISYIYIYTLFTMCIYVYMNIYYIYYRKWPLDADDVNIHQFKMSSKQTAFFRDFNSGTRGSAWIRRDKSL